MVFTLFTKPVAFHRQINLSALAQAQDMYDFHATAVADHCHIWSDNQGVGAERINVCLSDASFADLTGCASSNLVPLFHHFGEGLASHRLVLDLGDAFLAEWTHVFGLFAPLINALEAKLVPAVNLALLLLVNEFQADRARLLLPFRVHLPHALRILVHRAPH